MKVISETRRAH